jgi:Nucleotidyltransferase domain
MDLSRPYASVAPSLDGDVLRVLASSKLALTGRQVATMAGRTSHSGVLKVLDRLVEHGLVGRVELNRAYLYSLNRDHLAAPAVEILMNMSNTLIDRMRTMSSEWNVQPTHLSMFGSAARGDGGTESDIDLFAVRTSAVDDDNEAWRQQIEDLRAGVERWTGNPTSVIEVSEVGMARLAAEGAAIIDELRHDGVLLAGENLGVLLKS